MAFDWSSAGGPPASDEIEVTVIGPGFGESILVHVGNGRWLIIDSCVDTRAKDEYPAALSYLEAIGVDPAQQVDLVLATHWHQDHVRGLARIVQRCPSAIFSCARAMLTEEFQTYLLVTGRRLTTTFSSKPQEMVEVLRTLTGRSQTVRYADAGRELHTWKNAESIVSCRALALSPSDKEYERFITRVAALMPKDREPILAATPGDPNEVAVVLQLTWPNDVSVLLGADMILTGDADRGWKAVMVEHAQLGLPRSAIVKIPHHGSLGAHYQLMWDDGLESDRIAVVAPYGRGPVESRPPKAADLKRIAELASRSYLTSSPRGTSRDKFDSAVERTLDEGGIQISDATPLLGVVQLRRTAGIWRPKLLPPAMALPKVTAA